MQEREEKGKEGKGNGEGREMERKGEEGKGRQREDISARFV
jgi:hypothetical protein